MTTDRDVIRRSIDEPRAFAEIFERHARVVGAYAARRLGRDAADDVLSETFLIAFRRRRSFDPAFESARPWLLGIATRVMKKHASADAAQWRAFAAAAGLRDRGADAGFDDAGDRADAAASVRALAPRIAAMARRDRDTLLLYAWGDLTYEEIARTLGVPVGTVRSRLNRARRILADGRVLDQEGGTVDGRLGSTA